MKHKLLLTILFFALVTYSYSQVPANDLIENAIEVPVGQFVDAGLRLDLATSNGLGGSDCGVDSFKRVYYKFTTTDEWEVNVSITDPNNNSIDTGGSFVIPYSATDLNQTGESELQVVPSTCFLGTSVSFRAEAGVSYYVQVARELDVERLTDVTFSIVDLSTVRPANDLIENAIEIEPEFRFYQDTNLRLDAATNAGVAQSSCGVSSFKRVYYKYTSTEGALLKLDLVSNTAIDPNNSFIIPFTAPDLNQTVGTNLQVIPGFCQFGTSIEFFAEAGQSYYIQVSRQADFGSLTTFNVEVSEEANPADEAILIDLYNSTNGPNWNTPWDLNLPVGAWNGVTLEDGKVTQIFLNNRNLVGSIPISIIELSDLISFSVPNNQLVGQIPDFSSNETIESVNLINNRFSIQDFESTITANLNLNSFRYSPQISNDDEVEVEPAIGSTVELNMTEISGTSVQYQWYTTQFQDKDRFDSPVEGAISNSFQINNIQNEDLNTYLCVASSAAVPDLRVVRPNVSIVGPVSQAERDALVAFYNALGGENWSRDNENWLSDEPVSTWGGVSTSGNRVTGLSFFFSGMVGVIPDEISDLVHLTFLSLADNGIVGELPESLYGLTKLEALRLQGTGNTGGLSEDIGNLVNLVELRLIGNGFSGPFPQNIGNLTNLEDLYVIGSGFVNNGLSNNFSGTLPANLGNLTKLFRLQVTGHDIEGAIPDISGLTQLTTFALSDNELFGDLPDFPSFDNPENVSINLENNLFNFSELSSLVNNNITYGFLSYSPQRTRDVEEEVETEEGVDIVLDVNATGIDRNRREKLQTNVYEWFKDDVALPNSNSTTYTIQNAQEEDSGVYYCIITNATLPDLEIRRANITVMVDSALSIEDSEVVEFEIYPNPATNWLQLKFQTNQPIEFELYNLLGQQVLKQRYQGNLISVNVEEFPSGTYIAVVTNKDNLRISKKVIIE